MVADRESISTTISAIDALGLCRFTSRSATLDGSVPVRVARGCLPLLEGNALGIQLTLERPVHLVRRWNGWSLDESAESIHLARTHQACLAALVAQGYVEAGGEYHRILSQGIIVSRKGRLTFFTGIFLRPPKQLWLWVSGTANRRNLLVDIPEVVFPDSTAFVPLLLELQPKPNVRSLRLEGDLATIVPLWPHVSFDRLPLSAAPEVAKAHIDFYDAQYFSAKQAGDVTRKYRTQLGGPNETDFDRQTAKCSIIEAGPVDYSIEALRTALLPDGPVSTIPSHYGSVEKVVFRNPMTFTARYEGLSVELNYDKREIEKAARDIEARFESALGQGAFAAHRGALWYLTKYFTPHPPGEPHFFVKPWAFLRTPKAFSSIVDGAAGPEYDILRGVIRTDGFFATPAVFHLWKPGHTITVDAGAPLISVLPAPRALLAPRVDCSRPEGLPRLS